MITINLLPQEYRKKERTPLVMLLPIFGGVACVLSAFAVAAYVHFVWLDEVENERQQLEQGLAQRQPRLAYEKRLLAEEAEYKKRTDTITGIASSRILWTKIVDQFTDVAVAGDDSFDNDGYLIWLKELKTSQPRPQAARPGQPVRTSGGEITVKGFAVAEQNALDDYNSFHAAITGSDMFKFNFNDITKPTGSVEYFNDDKKPGKGWSIDFIMQLADPKEARERQAEWEKERLRAGNDDEDK